METLRGIGRRLRKKRIEKKFTEEGMAKLLDLPLETYKRMEAGGENFDIESLTLICAILHVSADWILTGQPGLLEYAEMIRAIRILPEDYREFVLEMPESARQAAEQEGRF